MRPHFKRQSNTFFSLGDKMVFGLKVATQGDQKLNFEKRILLFIEIAKYTVFVFSLSIANYLSQLGCMILNRMRRLTSFQLNLDQLNILASFWVKWKRNSMTDLPPVFESAKIRLGGYCTCPPCLPQGRRGLNITFSVSYKRKLQKRFLDCFRCNQYFLIYLAKTLNSDGFTSVYPT